MLDAAMLTLDETLLLQDSAAELDLEIILVTNVSAGADALFARAPLTSLKDRAGQRIGVENTALGAYFLPACWIRPGCGSTICRWSACRCMSRFSPPSPPAQSTLSSPSLRRARRWSKGARRIFDSRQLPGEIVDVLVVDRQRVTREQRRRLDLWFDALRTWQDNRGETDPRLHARLGLTPMALQVTLDGLLMGDRAVNREWSDEGQLQSIGQLSQYLRERRLLNGSNPVNLIARCEGPIC